MLILARHGQTTANAAGLLLGRLDPELNETGRLQAEAIARALGPVDRVIASPLSRARATAEALGQPVEIDDRWIEIDYGSYDGVPLAEVPAALWESWRRDPGYALPGGESLASVGERVRRACDQLQDEAIDRQVLVVSHVSPIKAAVAWALGVGDAVSWRMFLDVGAVCRVQIGPRGPSLRSYNDTSHLAG